MASEPTTLRPICQTFPHHGRPATHRIRFDGAWIYKCDECVDRMETSGWFVFEKITESDEGGGE